jgi:hypothetical protein
MSTTNEPNEPNTTTTPNPPGAVSVGEWRREGGFGDEFRRFQGTHRPVVPGWEWVSVDIDGDQFADGRVEYLMTVRSRWGDIPLRVRFAGPLAEAIAAAGDEIERLSGPRADVIELPA